MDLKRPFTVHSMKKFSNDELKGRLTAEQFAVTQEAATELAGSGKFNLHKEKGIYTCVVCGEPLFSSSDKFNSGSGWPSFDRAVREGSIGRNEDTSLGMTREEVVCSNCGAHLGHAFNDGPEVRDDKKEPTGERLCINSASLGFKDEDNSSSKGTQ